MLVSSNLDLKKSQCIFTPPVNEPTHLGDFRWNDRYVASADVDDANGGFENLSSTSQNEFFTLNYKILVAPGIVVPQVSLKVATVMPPSQEVKMAAATCTAAERAGAFLCTASSLSPVPSRTFLQLDGQIFVGGKAIDMKRTYDSVP